MIRAVAFALTLMAAPLGAETLADIRQDIELLKIELLRLNGELTAGGTGQVAVGGSALDRLNAIESELQRVTAKAEELEFRIGQVVKDGTNRLGDLEFRVCEVEPGCDIAALGEPALLGGGAPAGAQPPETALAAPPAAALPTGGVQLAVSEEADFRDAQKALDDQAFGTAARLFAQFREIYPMGPLEAAALIGEGQGLAGQGDTREAARRYLKAYSDFPNTEVAPEALWRLGVSLATLGSVNEACVTLGEVSKRYAASDFAAQAVASRAELGCS